MLEEVLLLRVQQNAIVDELLICVLEEIPKMPLGHGGAGGTSVSIDEGFIKYRIKRL